MVACPLGEDFRACCEQRPPLVTSILCLISLAVAFGGLGAYVYSHEVKNPDITLDWNTFLQSLSQHPFCLLANGTEDLSPSLWPTDKPELNQTISPKPAQGWAIISILAGQTFQPLGAAVGDVWIPKRARLGVWVTGLQLGLTGQDAEQMINFTAVPWHPQGCGGETSCLLSEITASCITLTAPVSLLPTSRKPLDCGVHPSPTPPLLPNISTEVQGEGTAGTPSCYQAKYSWDPSLTTMLSEADRSLCRVHLLYASCILLFIAGGLSCLGAVCSLPTREPRLRQLL